MPASRIDADDARTAKDILTASGVRAGLCAHVGCGREGSPRLTAELAAGSKLLIHGICWDSAALARAQAAINAKEVTGQASVEKTPGGALPYVRHLCNLIVVEDMKALLANGIGRDELMRVLAPRGTLCILENGRWTKTVQPRPEEMDDWTHPHHGPDGNMVSTDRLVRFPIGLRWIGGTPRSINKWAGVRGWVLANGRCYIVSSSEIDNLGLEEKTHYLVCRDAFNGLPLWKIPLATVESGGALHWRNTCALAADEHRVYAAGKRSVIIVDGATGKIEHTIKTEHQPERMVLLDNTLVLSCWKERGETLTPFERGGLWGPRVNVTDEGGVEAYAHDTGKRLWRLRHCAYYMLAADGLVYLMTRDANPATANNILALDIRSGKELWRVAHTELGDEPDLQLDLAGPGFLAVSKRKKESLTILDAKTGKRLWSKQYSSDRPAHWKGLTSYRFIALVNGQLWYCDEKHNPLTGEVVGKLPEGVPRVGATICVPPIVFGNVFGISRRSRYIELADVADSSVPIRTHMLHSARGSCIQGMTPANGMLYTAQNTCQCEPGQIFGFLALGPNGDAPTEEVFGQVRPVERGPAFADARPEPSDTNAWPMHLANPQRNRTTAGSAPGALDILWQASVAGPHSSPMKAAWAARMAPVITPPVAASGRVFLAAAETGQVKAFDVATGKPAWTVALGSRIDSAPTILGNLCVVGSRDGWVYAFIADKGTLAWRARVAPLEQRIVVNGRVESTWPAVGSVLAHDGKLLVNAGRGAEADGGIAVVQLDPATGETTWAGMIGGASKTVVNNVGGGPEHHRQLRMQRRIDLLRVAEGAIVCNERVIEPHSGIKQERLTKSKNPGGPILDGYLGRFKMRGFNASADTRAIAREHVVVAKALPEGGQIQLVNKATGEQIASLELDSAPICDGLAVANGRIVVALSDGKILCLGNRE
jgi:outer membrane protein assembly factor BamB